MRILITGGAGCLGSNLVERYVSAGHEVFAIDNFATGRREVLPAVKGLEIAEGTIADEAFVEGCFAASRPTHVIHAAAAYKDPDDWTEDTRTNVLGTVNVGEAARRHGVSRLVNFQTALCYGRPHKVPIPIDHPVQPFTSYGISKTAGEQYLLMLADVPVVSLRLANVTGPHLAIGPIPTFYKTPQGGSELLLQRYDARFPRHGRFLHGHGCRPGQECSDRRVQRLNRRRTHHQGGVRRGGRSRRSRSEIRRYPSSRPPPPTYPRSSSTPPIPKQSWAGRPRSDSRRASAERSPGTTSTASERCSPISHLRTPTAPDRRASRRSP